MRFSHTRLGRATAAFGVAGTLAVATGVIGTPAFAAQTQQQFMCGGQAVTIQVNDNHSSENGGWGAGMVDSGHLIPTSFSFSAYDVTAGQYLFDPQVQQKGMGNANHMQSTITCTQSMSASLADLMAQDGAPPAGLPDWAQPTDTVTLTFTVTAVPVG